MVCSLQFEWVFCHAPDVISQLVQSIRMAIRFFIEKGFHSKTSSPKRAKLQRKIGNYFSQFDLIFSNSSDQIHSNFEKNMSQNEKIHIFLKIP